MIIRCGHCMSYDIMAASDVWQCLSCGKFTDAHGVPVVSPPPNELTAWFGRRNVDGGSYDNQES